jgi:iron complex outermembrane receptor protein
MQACFRRHALLAGAALGLMGLAAQGARAEMSAANPVSAVTVTAARLQKNAAAATKTDTPIAETPQSITVIGLDQIRLLGVQDLNQALHFTAGVSPDTRGNVAGRYDLLNLRGFSPDQYLDGLRLIGSASGYDTPQVDVSRLERIEVIKGPASVLYGEASPGGLIALSSKLPQAQAGGEVALSGGSFATVQGEFDVGGPIDADGRLLFRLYGMANRSDTPIRLNESERYTTSPALTWRPDDKTVWTLLYNNQTDPRSSPYGSLPPVGSLLDNPKGRIPVDFYDGEPGYERFRRDQNAISSFLVRDLGEGWSFHQNLRFMRTTTSYRSVYSSGLEADFETLDRYTAASDESVDSFTLDNQVTGHLQTGPLSHSVIFGVDYQHTGQDETAGFGGPVAPINIFAPVYGAAIPDPATTFDIRLNLGQTGAYAQDQIGLGHLRLMLSGRYDWVDATQFDKLAQATTRLSEGQFSGRAGLLYLFDDGLAPYASYSTSFQPQVAETFSGSLLAPTQGKQAEVGLKYQPRIWDALLTASVYDLTQTNVATGDPTHPGFSVAAGEVRSRGVELEGRAHPIPAVLLSGSYTYLDNIVTKDNSGLKDTRPYGVPQQTANGFGVYSWQGGGLYGFSLGGGLRYLGQSFNGVAGAGSLKIPPATLLDLIASYDFGKASPRFRGLTLNVNVTNLLDARYVSACYSTIWCWYGAQRSAQATLRYRW